MIRPDAPSTKVTQTPECPFCLPKWGIRIWIPDYGEDTYLYGGGYGYGYSNTYGGGIWGADLGLWLCVLGLWRLCFRHRRVRSCAGERPFGRARAVGFGNVLGGWATGEQRVCAVLQRVPVKVVCNCVVLAVVQAGKR